MAHDIKSKHKNLVIFYDSIREHSYFIALTGLYVAISWFLGIAYGDPSQVKFTLYSSKFYEMLVVTLLLMCAYYVYRIAFIEKSGSLYKSLLAGVKKYALNIRLITSIAVIAIAFPLIASSLTILKTLLPDINPFYLDPYLVEIDKTLHFGTQPWEIIQPLLGKPYITFLVNVVYNFWFFIQLFVVIWQMFSVTNPRLRMQFMISYVLIWMILGSGLAIVLSSVGPCFYSKAFHVANPYDQLFLYLTSTNEYLSEYNLSLWALSTQEYLWTNYESSSLGIGSGISAMPSMHIAIAVLIAIVGIKANRIIGLILVVHAILIFLGSVHLGWHYAIDGYVSAIAAIAVWRFAGLFVKNIPETRPLLSISDTLKHDPSMR